ncbi:S9 family peptidase [Funiculus sociatus GB2-A5]|uniref:S9 family peptidase n=1 Tax=Funiculus sociatus GB2-A5 TaxID=2933946 RepID=A0ABV0JRH7_9CYAN|nr:MULTISPECIES: S9 family peptidase [unclassified Trichocoleus]MBD1907943.1 prolyl oligopeptidase family serine peptidase [Trichocoleus sp. FACHB-832]MBD2064801.1 prolyl oligopeptidase family serine peptidase [Trichocoleus sp. FACHB-6]
MTQQVKPYGSWKSPITSDLMVSETIGLGQIAIDGEDVYWIEGRPAEAGRTVIVRSTPDGQTIDIAPPPFNVRTRVNEYGGGAYCVADGIVYFSNFADQRLYRLIPGSQPQPLTPEAKMSYADAIIDRQRNRLYAVREDHTGEGQEAVNTLVSINLENGEDVRVLVSGNDFYSSPRLKPDGSQLVWLTWNHPNMPWDGTELWVAQINPDGSLGESQLVAGGADESIFQPEWSPDGILHFVSDRSGWWNLYKKAPPVEGEGLGLTEPLCEMEAEFGLPQWIFGMSTYAFESANRIICTYTQQGIWHLASLDTTTGKLQQIETPYTEITSLKAVAGRVAFIAGSPTEFSSIVQLDLTTGQRSVLRRSSKLEIDTGYLSIAQPIEFPTENGLTAYGFYYAPQNHDFMAPEGELPPLVVKSHGGPTAATSSQLNLRIQYWTSRGFAYLDVNYGGSTGYGRAYHQRLDGLWGVVDVDDCVNGAKYLSEKGLVDENRMAIAGGSAGGYTTLCALTFRDVFKAGASYYGVSDLEALLRDTHKFESRYFDRLIGPYPERQDIYHERSPIHFTDKLSCPIIFFQGLEDKVVPPNQAEMMVDVLRSKGLPVAYVAFEGEQHGFRRAENIKRVIDGEFYFYSRVFGFELAHPVEPIAIANL